MNAPAPSPGSPIWRDVLVILLAGSALGAAFNQIQLRSGEPGKGLAWVKTQPRLASLESLLADSAAAPPSEAPADTAHAPAAVPPATPPTPAAQELAAKPHAAARDSSRKPSAEAPATRPGTPTSAAPTPAPASPPSTAPPASAPPSAADVPTIPDTREPLEVQYATVKKLFDAGAAVFVDARSPEEFAEGHIRGAVNLPFDDVFRKPDLAKQLADGGKPIVAYCGGGDCELSRNLAFSLIEAGHRKVLVFLGGTSGWTAAGQALEKGSAK